MLALVVVVERVVVLKQILDDVAAFFFSVHENGDVFWGNSSLANRVDVKWQRLDDLIAGRIVGFA